QDGETVVLAGVVDVDDLEIQPAAQGGGDFDQKGRDVVALVEYRHDHGKLWHGRGFRSVGGIIADEGRGMSGGAQARSVAVSHLDRGGISRARFAIGEGACDTPLPPALVPGTRMRYRR